MALSFPLSTANFLDTVQVVASKPFNLQEARQFHQTAGGEIIDASVSTRLWQGSISLRPRRHVDAAEFAAKLQLLTHGGRTFFAYDPTHAYPKADPTGSILGGSSPQISSLNANNRELVIKLLPAGYVISPGDFLAFTYGSSPTRYALHQVVVGSTANGSGVTGSIEVIPNIRTGAAVNAVITLKKPTAKFLIQPGGFDIGNADILFTTGVSFSFIQTLR